MTPDPREQQAKRRFWLLSLVRLGGAMLVLFGIVVTAGRLQPIAPAAGYLLIVLGLVAMSLIPRWLARRWRTPPDA